MEQIENSVIVLYGWLINQIEYGRKKYGYLMKIVSNKLIDSEGDETQTLFLIPYKMVKMD